MEKLLKWGLFIVSVFFAGLVKANAASAYIDVSSSASNVVVGNTFTVNVSISSAVPLGSWEYVIDYDSTVLKYVSGNYSVVDWGNGSKTAEYYSYTFKAIASGSGYISVKSYRGIAWDESEFSMSVGSTSVNVISQEQLEASYSKDNSLSNITVGGAELTPAFSTDVKDYKVTLSSENEKVFISATPNDSRATVTGVGDFNISEGENKFEIIVTAENGSQNTYTVTVVVEDPNPLKVKTSDNKELTVVKRASTLEKPKTFEEKTIKINGIEVPGFYSNITKIVLVGLKDEKGKIELYSYDSKNNSYTLYREITFNSITIYPLELVKNDKFNNYIEKEATINDKKVGVYKPYSKSNFSIFYGKNIENNEEGYFIYDEKNQSVIAYSDEELVVLNEKILNFQKIIIVLSGIVVILLMIVIALSTTKKKKIKKLIKKLKEQNEEKIEVKKEPKITIEESVKEKKNKKSKKNQKE